MLLSNRFYRRPLITSLPAAFPWMLLSLVALCGLLLRHEAMRRPGKPVIAPAAPRPPAQIETRISALGMDSHNRSLPFTVYVLTQQLSWKLRSATDLEEDRSLMSPELVSLINGARDVFCVGTASFEGEAAAEATRASQRARTLARWVGSVIEDPAQTRVYTLNAGQYQGPKDLGSTDQRKAIIIITGPHHEEVNLGEGLASGLEQQQQSSPVVYSLLHHYSRSKEWLRFSHDPANAIAGRKPGASRRRRSDR